MNLTYSFDWCFLFLPLGVTVSKMFVESFEEPVPQGIQPCDDDLIELYLSSDLETRTEILVSYPQVAGFVFLEKNISQKRS